MRLLNFRWLENVTSLQKIENQSIDQAEKFANEYFKWLPRFMGPFIQVHVNEGIVQFLFLQKIKLLQLEKSHERSERERSIYYITGGILARETTLNGRLEFRYIASSKCLITALLDFRPSLPWFIYKYSQALVHLYVMKKFSQYLQRKYK